MYLGKAGYIRISSFDKQTVINLSNDYCTKHGYQIFHDTHKHFRLFKWKWEYVIELYKPKDFKVTRF